MAIANAETKEIHIKIVYYGPALVGKTTNLKYIHATLPPEAKGDLLSFATETERSLFFDFSLPGMAELNGFKLRFHLYCVPGCVLYESTRAGVLKGADGVIFVADSNPNKLRENVQQLQELARNIQASGQKFQQFPLVLQYNKRDVPNAIPVEQMDYYLNSQIKVPRFLANTAKGEGVWESFNAIAELIISPYKLVPVQPSAKPLKNLAELIQTIQTAPLDVAKKALRELLVYPVSLLTLIAELVELKQPDYLALVKHFNDKPNRRLTALALFVILQTGRLELLELPELESSLVGELTQFLKLERDLLAAINRANTALPGSPQLARHVYPPLSAEFSNSVQHVLANLPAQACREDLCKLALDAANPHLRKIAVAANYAPTDLTERAFFYFVTEQWQKYAGLDFDVTLMSAMYAKADSSQKKQIIETARTFGRPELVEILVGQPTRLPNLAYEEWELATQTLLLTKRWERAWEFVPTAPPSIAAQLLKALAGTTWLPERESEHTTFEKLAEQATWLTEKKAGFGLDLQLQISTRPKYRNVPFQCLFISHSEQECAYKAVLHVLYTDGEAEVWDLALAEGKPTAKINRRLDTQAAAYSWNTINNPAKLSEWGQRLRETSLTVEENAWGDYLPKLKITATDTLLSITSGYLAGAGEEEPMASAIHDLGKVVALSVSKAGRLVVSHRDRVSIWTLPQLKLVNVQPMPEEICEVRFSVGGNYLMTVNAQGEVGWWTSFPHSTMEVAASQLNIKDFARIGQLLNTVESTHPDRDWLLFMNYLLGQCYQYEINVDVIPDCSPAPDDIELEEIN